MSGFGPQRGHQRGQQGNQNFRGRRSASVSGQRRSDQHRRYPQKTDRQHDHSRKKPSHQNTSVRGSRESYPMSLDNLKRILDMEKDLIAFELLRPHSGYRELIWRRDIPKSSVILIIQLLAKTIKCDLIKVTIQNLLEMTMQSEIRNSLIELADAEEADVIIPHVYAVSEYIMEKCSVSCSELVLPLLSAYMFTCSRISHSFSPKFEALREHALKLKSNEKKSISALQAQPPDDFRQLSVIPTIEELLEPERPFIRENRIKGSYQNLEDYLDVQFRLLKEDFCAPMREGIAHIVSGSKNRNYSFFFNKCVEAQGKDVVTWEVVWKFKIKNMKAYQISNKRLLMGNVICLSNDNFQTINVGYIFGVDEKSPFDIHIKFDIDPNVVKGDEFSMIETRALFLSYKYVLRSIQEKTFLPFEQEIVHCRGSTGPPDYSKYKLLNLHCLNAHELESSSSLSYWPSCEHLQLDESQRESIHGVFNNKVAVVQGPPGTGKTYIGLKITQIILDSFEQENIGPIVVVAYTNHALDQFLEGVLKFTRDIVRVGSRSKLEELQNYNIKSLVRNCLRRKQFPQSIASTNFSRDGLLNMKSQLNELRLEIEALKKPQGIFTKSVLFENQACAPRLQGDISSWLINSQVVLPLSFGETSHEMQDQKDWEEICKVNQLEFREQQFHEEDDDWANNERRSELPFYEVQRNLIENRLNIIKAEIDRLRKQSTNKQKSAHERENIVQTIWELENESRVEKEYMILLQAGLKITTVDSSEDIETLSFVKRWSIYNGWIRDAIKVKVEKLQKFIEKGQSSFQQHEDVQIAQELYVMRQARIVGLTTTGASRLSTLLDGLAPKIVIIEEAAEILEGHCIAPLTKSCEHLILIGDHMQLRPSTCVYDLAKNFHLDVSLFERLVKNGHKHYSLSVQHRMRPEISRLVASTLYPELRDHESVSSRQSVKGMEKDLFFFSHHHRENRGDEDSSSHKNEAEAHLVIALCCHLRNQNYDSSQITILTAYIGQLMLLRKMMVAVETENFKPSHNERT